MRKRKKLKQESSQGQVVKKSKTNLLSWLITIFLFSGFLTFLPSIASVLFLLNMVLVLPISKVQDSLKNVFPKKILKTALCWVLFLTATMIAPTDDATINDISAETVQSSEVEQSETVLNFTEAETLEESLEVARALENEPLPENSTFEIHYIDVGQADSALVLCDGKAMLIDGGNSKDSSLIYTYLKNHNISHLDYIVATHGHEDHVGGLAGALNYATVGITYCSVKEFDSEAFGDFVKYLDEQEKEIIIPKVGEKFNLGSSVVEILAINGNATDHNNASIVLRIKYGDTSFVFTGDAEREVEEKVLSTGYGLESTVLKVGHHGSEKATSNTFLKQIAPKYAVISVGEDNIYGHPTEETLNRLKDANVKTYRTDLQGTIVCVSDGTEVSFSVEKNEDADTFAPMATVEQLQDIIKKSVDKYNVSSGKKLDGYLTYKVVDKTEVQLTYTSNNPLKSNEEYLVNEAKNQILALIFADIYASNYSKAYDVEAEIKVDYEVEIEEQTPTTEAVVVGTDYIGNVNTYKFHYPWCSSVKRMKESNKYYFNGTRDEMMGKGYDPCQNCNP